MKLEDLLGTDYKEGMTTEEIAAALASKNFVDPATLPASVSKEQFDKTASEAAKYRKELAELKAAGLSDAEKLKQAQDEANAMKREFAVRLNRMDAEKVLIGAGIAEADYSPFIDAIVTEDANASVAAATAIAKMLTAQKKAVEAAVRKDMQDKMPTPDPNKKDPGMTKEEYAKLSFEDQHKFFTEHREEYDKMFE